MIHLLGVQFGPRAIAYCEPCQILTEAALSGFCGVPQVYLDYIPSRWIIFILTGIDGGWIWMISLFLKS